MIVDRGHFENDCDTPVDDKLSVARLRRKHDGHSAYLKGGYYLTSLTSQIEPGELIAIRRLVGSPNRTSWPGPALQDAEPRWPCEFRCWKEVSSRQAVMDTA